MDIRLPGMDGLEATRRIMAERPTPIVVIADAVEDASLKISMNALRAGALSVVEKPVGVTSAGYDAVASTICTQLYIMSQVPVVRQRSFRWRPSDPPAALDREDGRATTRAAILAIAASTGGPPALAKVLGAFPADFPLPVLVVQHMGAPFMEGFASWLNGLTPLDVRLAQDGEVPIGGRVYVAPGDRHLALVLVRDPADQRRCAGGQPAPLGHLSVPVPRPVRGTARTRRAPDRHGRGRRAGPRRACAAPAPTPWRRTRAPPWSTGCRPRPCSMGGARASLPLDLIAPRLLRLARARFGGRAE